MARISVIGAMASVTASLLRDVDSDDSIGPMPWLSAAVDVVHSDNSIGPMPCLSAADDSIGPMPCLSVEAETPDGAADEVAAFDALLAAAPDAGCPTPTTPKSKAKRAAETPEPDAKPDKRQRACAGRLMQAEKAASFDMWQPGAWFLQQLSAEGKDRLRELSAHHCPSPDALPAPRLAAYPRPPNPPQAWRFTPTIRGAVPLSLPAAAWCMQRCNMAFWKKAIVRWGQQVHSRPELLTSPGHAVGL